MKSGLFVLSAVAGLALSAFSHSALAATDDNKELTGDQKAAMGKHEVDGKWLNEQDIITFNIQKDGTVDWYTYNGFRRYHSECHVCHGPDGLGSTYAPALVDSVKRMSYYDFLETVMSGRERHLPDGSISKMPMFGDNMNVSCYVEDIYAYLQARASGELPRGRPKKRAPKPEGAKEAESACR